MKWSQWPWVTISISGCRLFASIRSITGLGKPPGSMIQQTFALSGWMT